MKAGEKTKDKLLVEIRELQKENSMLKSLLRRRCRDRDKIKDLIKKEPANKADRSSKATCLLEAFFEQNLIAKAIFDRNFNFLLVNEAYAKSTGYPVEKLIGRNHFELYPDAEAEAIFKQVVETKRPYQVFGRPFVYPGFLEN